MREPVEDIMLSEIRAWLPPSRPSGRGRHRNNWKAVGLNNKRWGIIRVVDPFGMIVARVKMHRGDNDFNVSCEELIPREGKPSFKVDGPLLEGW